MTICTERCWDPEFCSQCSRIIPPSGRSIPLAASGTYCTCKAKVGASPRHLWSEHDDARQYTDPSGYTAHVAICPICAPKED